MIKVQTIIFVAALIAIATAVSLFKIYFDRSSPASELSFANKEVASLGGSIPPPPFKKPVRVVPVVKATSLQIMSKSYSRQILLQKSEEGGPALWIENPTLASTVQAGLHANGFPFLLVSDREIVNFGLGRVDGYNATPILVFRSMDTVKLILGLNMTEKSNPPFMVYYPRHSGKELVFGNYCDARSRVCVK